MSKWISVKDRLPIGKEDVLVLIKKTEHSGKYKDCEKIYYLIYVGAYLDGRWATAYCFGYNFVDNEMKKSRGASVMEVTHWKPLPKLPKFLRK